MTEADLKEIGAPPGCPRQPAVDRVHSTTRRERRHSDHSADGVSHHPWDPSPRFALAVARLAGHRAQPHARRTVVIRMRLPTTEWFLALWSSHCRARYRPKWGRSRQFLTTKVCCFLWRVAAGVSRMRPRKTLMKLIRDRRTASEATGSDGAGDRSAAARPTRDAVAAAASVKDAPPAAASGSDTCTASGNRASPRTCVAAAARFVGTESDSVATRGQLGTDLAPSRGLAHGNFDADALQREGERLLQMATTSAAQARHQALPLASPGQTSHICRPRHVRLSWTAC